MVGLALAMFLVAANVASSLEPRADHVDVESHSVSAPAAGSSDPTLWVRLTGEPLGQYERACLWIALGLTFVLALKVLHRRMIAVYDSVTKERRAITYNFKTRLPVRATIWWRYKGVDTLLTPELEWDGKRFKTQPKENFVRWAKPNRLHAASLVLCDKGALDASHFVEFHVSLWIPLARKLKWSDELQFDTLDRTSPVGASLPLPDAASSEHGDEVTWESASRETPVPPRFARPNVQGTADEGDLVFIANEFINSEIPDRVLLRQRLAEKGVSLDFYSPTRVQDSANCIFTRHWFKPDAHAGGWLWAETDSSFMAVPFDRSQLTAETMRHYLSSLYQGLGSGFDAQTRLYIESACWLVRGREPDEFVIVKPGQFAGHRASKTAAPLSPPRATKDGREERRRKNESDAVGARFQERLDSFESQLGRLAERGKSDDGSRRQVEAVQDELRDFINRTERELNDFRMRLVRLEGDFSSLKAARDNDKARPHARAGASREDLQALQLGRPAFGADSAEPPDLEPIVPRFSPPAQPNPSAPPSESARFSSLNMPADWKPFVAAAGSGGGVDDYLDTLQRAYERLSCLHRGVAKIVHLVESGDHGVYAVHMDDRLEIESGQLVARCAEKPGFRTPSKQFFLALAEAGQESLWILCPPGAYSSLGFDYPTLIDNVPASSFTIASIVRPARLDRKDSVLYRIAVRMNVTFS